MQHAPYPWDIVALHHTVAWIDLRKEIQDKCLIFDFQSAQLGIGHASGPLLDQPDGIFVIFDHLLLDGLIDKGNIHVACASAFMERVYCIIIGHIAKDIALILIETISHLGEVIFLSVIHICPQHIRTGIAAPGSLLDDGRISIFLIKVGRHHAGETAEHWDDAIRLHTVMHLSGQFHAILEPAVWQFSAIAGHVLHIVPGKVSRSAKILFDLCVSITVILQGPADDFFLTDDIEHQVDAGHGGPVQERFIFIPVPECHRIGICTEIQRITHVVIRFLDDRLTDFRQCFRHIQL